MNSDAGCRGLPTTIWGMVVLSLGLSAFGAEPPDPATDDDSSDEVLTEQSIYIPYSKLREIFEKEGRGVFLPYGEFEKLWRAARDKGRPPSEAGPPVDALITEVENEATVSQDVVRVKARVQIEILAEGWHQVPLRLSDAAITKATLGDQPARIVFEPGVGYKLLVEKKGTQAELLELALEYVKAFEKAPGRNSVSFQAPQAPVSRWRIRIPEPGVKVNIHPLIAATQVPDEGEAGQHPDQTVVLAFVGAAPTIKIDWTPKAEGATGLEALASVQSEQQVRIDEGVIHTRTQLAYSISRAALSQLAVEVPADHRVTNVFDANVRQWSVEKADNVQRITVQLFEPAQTAQSITIELEQFVSGDEQRTLQAPMVRALDAGRQQGVVVVQVAAGLRAESIRHTGLLQVDAAELPKSLAKGKWTFSYRYGALPFDLTLQVEKVQPRIVVDSLVEALLEPEQMTLDLLAVYNVERAGVFRLELDIPEGYEVRHVGGRKAAGAEAAQVDTHYLEGQNKTRLVVNLSGKALGRVALAVKLQRRLAEPDLLSPTGKAADIPLAIPRVVPSTVERASGRLVVYAPESLRVNPGKVEGLRSIPFKEALEQMASVHGKGPPGARRVLAFAYKQEEVVLSLAVERRKPQVTTRQLLVAQIEAGVVKYKATFFYDILYSGVKSLRIDVPGELAGEIRNTTSGVREKVIDPPPEDLAEACVAWSLTGETEFIGSVTIRLAWEDKIEKLEVGKSIELAIPRLRPMDVDRAWGQIVLTKAETIDVREAGEPQGIRPIDPQHDLKPGADVPGAARAFEFHADWDLSMTVTRYKLEEVRRTSIERAVLQMVVTRSDQISVQALYRMRSARQRLAVKLPGNVEFDRGPLRINGRPVALERGDQDDFFVPLVGLNADEAFLMELRYTISGSGMRLDPPVFPSEPAVQKVYLCAYLPHELAYLGSIGPWSDELRWRWEPVFDCKPVARRSRSELVTWVGEDISTGGGPADTFQTDGRLYLFSALRPSPVPQGSLRLVAMDEDWLSGLVLTAVIVVGLILLRNKAATRWLAMGVFVVALVLMGVFFASLSRQVIDDKLLSAICVVLVVWLVQYAAWSRPRDPVLAARRKGREEARLARIRAKASPPPPAEEAEPPPPSPPDKSGDTSDENKDEDQKEEGGSANA